MNRDVFVCHASEDKEKVVRPLVVALEQAGFSCWFDEAEIKWGDSITQKVNEGLAKSQFVIVVLSASFLGKRWPQRELNAVLNIEAASGMVKVLPLLVGDSVAKRHILDELPILNDKRYLTWEGSSSEIISALQSRLLFCDSTEGRSKSNLGKKTAIYAPQIKRRFTDRDRDAFLAAAFKVIEQYFQQAVHEVSEQYENIECQLTIINSQKFLCKIYVDGDCRRDCKIWIGGMMCSDSICYYEGRGNVENDNSFNEILKIMDDGREMYLQSTLGLLPSTRLQKASPEAAAESLWKRFCAPLEQ